MWEAGVRLGSCLGKMEKWQGERPHGPRVLSNVDSHLLLTLNCKARQCPSATPLRPCGLPQLP